MTLSNNAEITGGTIGGGGTVTVDASTASAAALLDGLTINAAVNIANGKHLKLQNTVTNNGTITLNDVGTYDAYLNTSGNVTLDGSGKVLFASSGRNYFTYTNTGDVLTIGANQTVATSGTGTKGEIRVVTINNGTIDADGGSLILSVHGKTNNNLFRSQNGGNLDIGVAITNTAGTITIDGATGGTMTLNNNAEITGGTIGGGGTVTVDAGTSSAAALLDGLTITAAVNIANGKYLKLQNTVTNNGTITLNDVGIYDAYLNTSGNVTLDGSGQVLFASGGTNRISYTDTADVLTVGANQTVSASVGDDGTISVNLINQGTVNADGTIDFISGRTFTNALGGTISGSGTINLNGVMFVNNGRISPGNSPGTLTIEGNVPFSASAGLFIEIADSAYDCLNVSGTASLDGSLDMELLGGFTPGYADEFVILTAADVTGTFDHAPGKVYFAQGMFDVIYDADSVTLTHYEVPEPATMSLLVLGGLALLRRKRK